MKISIRYLKDKDIFSLDLVDEKLRSEFLLTRTDLNKLRSILEQALIESKGQE